MRRSKLVALDVADLRFSDGGLYVWIAAAKNDQRKQGCELYVPRLPATGPMAELCPVAALERRLKTVGATGPVFRRFNQRGRLTENGLDPGDVARILRPRAAAAGVAGDFAGHSLRRGFITATKKRVPIENIKRVTGQRSRAIVLDYVAAATPDDYPPDLEIVGARVNWQNKSARCLREQAGLTQSVAEWIAAELGAQLGRVDLRPIASSPFSLLVHHLSGALDRIGDASAKR